MRGGCCRGGRAGCGGVGGCPGARPCWRHPSIPHLALFGGRATHPSLTWQLPAALQEEVAPALETKKFEQLEALLERSRAYTQFLTEQVGAAGEGWGAGRVGGCGRLDG